MSNFYNLIVDSLGKCVKLDDTDKELYNYALKIIFQFVITFIPILISSICLGMTFECIAMFLSFVLIRKFAGGIHAEKFLSCFIMSVITNVLGLILIKEQWFLSSSAFVIINCISLIIILLLKPAIHPNKVSSKTELKRFKLFSSIIAIIVFILILLTYNKFPKIAYAISTGKIIATIMLILGTIKYRIMNKA